MKIGLMAFSTNTGLGYQTREFYNNISCEKILIVDISDLNNIPTDHSWVKSYEDFRVTDGIPTNEDCEWLVDGVDIVFVCETPLNYHLFEYAEKKGVKTVLQYNYEFLDYLQRPELPKPTVLAAPSNWNTLFIENKKFAPVINWPVPVENTIPFRKIDKVETIIHIIGRPAAKDRNGTLSFLKMAKIFGKRFKYEIYIQPPKDHRAITHFEAVQSELLILEAELWPNLKIIADTPLKEDMYKNGDVLVLPRRYGGLCLPMWEALSAGMPVIMPNISPNNSILPKSWLCEAQINGTLKTRAELSLYDVFIDNPPATNHLVSVVEWMCLNIKSENLKARKIAENMSWKIQKDIYLERFKKLCE